MSITETLLDMIDSTAEKTTYSLTTAEIVELLEVANNGFTIEELIANDKVLNLKLSKAGSRNIVVTYPRTKEIKR